MPTRLSAGKWVFENHLMNKLKCCKRTKGNLSFRPMGDVVRFLLLSCWVVVGLSGPSTAEPTLPANADALVEEGIAAYGAEDYQRAKDILLPLAEAGHPEAMHRIGRLYDGKGVFPHDPKTECDWYEKAANKGLAKSMHNMGVCYDGFGRDDDIAQERAWLLKAAEKGFVSSMINLAALDPKKGTEYLFWMENAQKNNSSYARVSLWLHGYKENSQMSFFDFACVSWKVILMKGNKLSCD
ncbi:tetratricopeptide repeat protein [Magnetovibrio sp. PR-2]|uniref:tetratricopeptide repeat protein n=1 Tax=Magnetovibrio sp. PR-2 TaxID=3120356 RepID=UPI002FCE0947